MGDPHLCGPARRDASPPSIRGSVAVRILLAFSLCGGKQETPMELNLHPIATKCFVSGRDFQENDRVVCYLAREANGEVARRDLLETEDGRFMPPAFVYCRWVVAFKQRKADENPALTLK